MNNTRPILKLNFKTPPVLQQKKLEVYIPDKENVRTKPKSDTLRNKAHKLKENDVAVKTNSACKKISKNTSTVTPDQETTNARRAMI